MPRGHGNGGGGGGHSNNGASGSGGSGAGGGGKSNGGTSGSGGGGGNSRPPRPGKAWVWNGTKWVKPPKPNKNVVWTDDQGWVRPGNAAAMSGTGGGGLGGGSTVTRPGGGGGFNPDQQQHNQIANNLDQQQHNQIVNNDSASGGGNNGGGGNDGGGNNGGGNPPAAATPVRTETVQEGNAATGFYTVTYTYYSDGSRVETAREANTGRRNVYDKLNLTFSQASWGGVDLSAFLPLVDKWIQNGYADASNGDEIILNMLQSSNETLPGSSKTAAQLFAERFPGFAAANSNGKHMTLEEYRIMETGYITAMQQYGLPQEMYNDPADFGKLIAGSVSPQEVDYRIQTAQSVLNSTDPSVVDAFQRYYGVGRNDLLAYMLDGEKGKGIIEQRTRTAEVGGTAARYGFDLSADQASGYSNQGVLSGYSAVTPNSYLTGQSERLFSSAADVRNQDTRLSGIDQEQYNANDAIDVVFGDKSKELASKKRAEREAARFGGNSGVTTSSVARRGGV